MIFGKEKIKNFIREEVEEKIKRFIKELGERTIIIDEFYDGTHYITKSITFEGLVHKCLDSYQNDIIEEAMKEIKKEEFIDAVIERINKKQLK